MVFPILGIVVPLALWLLKRDKVKKVELIGKRLINFQLTWCLLLFAIYATTYIMIAFHIAPPIDKPIIFHTRPVELTLAVMPVVLYGYNFMLVIFNAFRSLKGRDACYKPALRLLK